MLSRVTKKKTRFCQVMLMMKAGLTLLGMLLKSILKYSVKYISLTVFECQT